MAKFHLKIPILILIVFVSCKPTYKAANLEESIIQLAKKEYSLDEDIKVKVIGKTISVVYHTKGLIDNRLKLRVEAATKIDSLVECIHRVCLSTDKELNFYTLCVKDKEYSGVEYLLIGNLNDVRSAKVSEISRSDYLSRFIREFKFNPMLVGEKTIKTFFERISCSASPFEVVKEYFYNSSKHDESVTLKIKRIIFPSLVIGHPESVKILISELKGKQISSFESVFLCKTKEYYTPIESMRDNFWFNFFPPGSNNQYLIFCDSRKIDKPITEIIPRYYVSEKGENREKYIEAFFNSLKESKMVSPVGFVEKDISLMDFILKILNSNLESYVEQNLKLEPNLYFLDVNYNEKKNEIFASVKCLEDISLKKKLAVENFIRKHIIKLLKSYDYPQYKTLNIEVKLEFISKSS